MNKNPNNLLYKTAMVEILSKHQKELDLTANFQLIEIKRSLALSPHSFILLVKIVDKNTLKLYRGNASTSTSRLTGFKTMKVLYENGFNFGNYKIPEHFIYDSNYNLLLYQDVPGEILIDQIKKNEDVLKRIEDCSLWLKKLHYLKSQIHLAGYNFDVNTKDLNRFYPELAENCENAKKELLSRIKTREKILIHGDFQPNNIIIKNDTVWVFDFNDAALDNPAIDIASFLAQLRTMMIRFSGLNKYDNYKDSFLRNYYHQTRINNTIENDRKIYEKLLYLKILAALSATLEDSDPKKKEILEKIYNWYNET